MKKWDVNNITSQSGRRILITGGNSGIGFQTALKLARCGAEIILPARTEAKAIDAIKRIRSKVPTAKLTSAVLDLASLASINSFAKFYGEHFPFQSLDLLINNAGVMALPTREITIDGFERQFAVNYIGPFVLTAMLFPYLKKQVGTRIVNTSTLAAHRSKIEFDNLQSERIYRQPYGAYSQSKLAVLIFMCELQRRLSAVNSPIISVGVHPGAVVTNITSNMTGFFKAAVKVVSTFMAQDAAQGAFPTIFAATSPEVIAGGYYGPNGFFEFKGYPIQVKLPPSASNTEIAHRLWEETEYLTGIAFNPSNNN